MRGVIDMKLGVHKCHPDAKMPFYATEGSACFDIAVVLDTDVAVMEPGQTVVFGTGLKLDIPKGYQLKLHVRSSTGIKKSLMLANVTGIIDSDYVEELKVALYNRSGGDVHVISGAVLAQAELQPVIQCDFEELEYAPLQKTSRNGGIGSTDTEENPWNINTGVQPVKDNQIVEVVFANGDIAKNLTALNWYWGADVVLEDKIVKWRCPK